VLLDKAPIVLGSADAVAVVLDALVGPIDEGDVERHGPAPFLCRKELAEAGICLRWPGMTRPSQRRSGQTVKGHSARQPASLVPEWALAVAAEQEPTARAERRIGHAAALGPSWGRETAVTHGQPRCLGDNENRSSTAVLAVMEPQVRIWHARNQRARASCAVSPPRHMQRFAADLWRRQWLARA
jgi:hypothetical protein